MALKKEGSTGSGKGFGYKPRGTDTLLKRANQSGGTRDWYLIDDVLKFTPHDKQNVIRVIPTPPDAPHWGMDVWVHFNIGGDNSAYLCLREMKGQDCPLCEAKRRAQAAGEAEVASSLEPTKRVLIWIIDRDKEKEGPKLWSMPWTLDRDVCKLVVDSRTGAVYNIDDPDDGYDVLFDREGTGQKTKYGAIQIDRRSSPLNADPTVALRWLEYVEKYPLEKCMVFQDYDYMRDIYQMPAEKKAVPEDRKEKEKEEPKESKGYDREPEKEKEKEKEEPKKEEPKKEEAPDSITYEWVDAADSDSLTKVLLDLGYDPADVHEASKAEMQKAIIDELKLTPATKTDSYAERVKKLRGK